VNVDRLRIQDRHAEEERICMRRLPNGAPVGGRVCQRGVCCKHCKGIAVRGVFAERGGASARRHPCSASAPVRGTVCRRRVRGKVRAV
jgi:hypothetical protein